MGQRISSILGYSAPQIEATLLTPSMQGDIIEVKRLVGIHIANNNCNSKSNNDNDNGSLQQQQQKQSQQQSQQNQQQQIQQHPHHLAAYANATDPAGNAAIHGAVFGGHLQVLTFLVESCGASLTLKNGLGCSPLWVAAGYDKLDCLEYLLEKITNSQQNPSKNSSNNDDNDDATNTINTANKNDNHALEAALLDANTSGDTPLIAAASKGNMGACKALLDAVDKYYHLSCSNSSSDGNDNRSSTWLMKRKLIRTANNGGDTPLSVAVAAGHDLELLKLFLELDEQVAKNLNDCSSAATPTTKATTTTTNEGDGSLEEEQSTKSVNKKNGKGLTPLIVACERNLPKVAQILLDFGADIHEKDSNGRNPLAIGAFCGCNDVVEFLLDRIQNSPMDSSLLNEVDDNGCTPVWLAARTGNVSMTKLLVNAGADVTIENNEGLTPQDVAVKFKKEGVENFFSETSSDS